MRKGADWIRLSECLTYRELVFIERALAVYALFDLKKCEQNFIQDLMELIAAARGWLHRVNKK